MVLTTFQTLHILDKVNKQWQIISYEHNNDRRDILTWLLHLCHAIHVKNFYSNTKNDFFIKSITKHQTDRHMHYGEKKSIFES